MRGIGIGLSVLLLSACGGAHDGAGINNNAATATATAANAARPTLDDTQRQVVAMAEPERNAVLIRAIRSAHLDCQHVDSSQAVANPAGQPSYIATCDRTKRYAVAIGPGGNGAVTSAQEPAR